MSEKALYSIIHTLADGSSKRVYCDAKLNRREVRYRARLFDRHKLARGYRSLDLYDSNGKLVLHKEA